MTAPDPSRDQPARPAAQGDTTRLENPEAALGGADAVEKTSAVVGRGTEPEARRADSTPAAAELPSGRGPNLLAWGVAAIAALIALVYLAGLLG
jgi:hypothetical protein